jgi:hypothetical protein
MPAPPRWSAGLSPRPTPGTTAATLCRWPCRRAAQASPGITRRARSTRLRRARRAPQLLPPQAAPALHAPRGGHRRRRRCLPLRRAAPRPMRQARWPWPAERPRLGPARRAAGPPCGHACCAAACLLAPRAAAAPQAPHAVRGRGRRSPSRPAQQRLARARVQRRPSPLPPRWLQWSWAAQQPPLARERPRPREAPAASPPQLQLLLVS